MSAAPSTKQSPPPPTPLRLFLIFSRIALTSFGGGLSGWFMREFVRDRGWLSEQQFFNGLALSQALPGVNIKNLAIWIGYTLCGWKGAVAGFAGTILPAMVAIILFGTVLSSMAGIDLVHQLLIGAGAAAVGLSLSMAITTVRRLPRNALTLGIAMATFVAIGPLHLSLTWTVLAAGAISVTIAYARQK